jgi:hypothetical protein
MTGYDNWKCTDEHSEQCERDEEYYEFERQNLVGRISELGCKDAALCEELANCIATDLSPEEIAEFPNEEILYLSDEFLSMKEAFEEESDFQTLKPEWKAKFEGEFLDYFTPNIPAQVTPLFGNLLRNMGSMLS